MGCCRSHGHTPRLTRASMDAMSVSGPSTAIGNVRSDRPELRGSTVTHELLVRLVKDSDPLPKDAQEKSPSLPNHRRQRGTRASDAASVGRATAVRTRSFQNARFRASRASPSPPRLPPAFHRHPSDPPISDLRGSPGIETERCQHHVTERHQRRADRRALVGCGGVG